MISYVLKFNVSISGRLRLNLKTLSYDEYQICKLDSKIRSQAARHHASLSRFIYKTINEENQNT